MIETLIIILARKGSKRLPGKNTKIFNGLPLCEWTISQASKFEYSTVVVSTDDEQIKQLALIYGCEVVDRSPELCNDTSTSEEAILDVMSKYQEHKQIMLLQVTSPLRTYYDLIKASFIKGKCVVSTNIKNKWNGAIYICDWQKFLKEKRFNPDKYYKMPNKRSIDIDTLEDFQAAEKYMQEICK